MKWLETGHRIFSIWSAGDLPPLLETIADWQREYKDLHIRIIFVTDRDLDHEVMIVAEDYSLV